MHIHELPTPAVLVDVDRVVRNVSRVMEVAKRFGKRVWPMVKTHKSSYIARIQRDLGAEGFTVGTLDEAETLVEKGIARNIMLGNVYVADRESFARVARLAELGARVILRIDSFEGAKLVNSWLEERGLELDYVVKVDTGLHRFGVRPEKVVSFVKSLQQFRKLRFVGIVTHPGHVYASTSPAGVERVAKEVSEIMAKTAKELGKAGFELEIVGTGSTPTLRFDLTDDTYTHLFPGNFVFYDRMQVELFGSATYDDCALMVLATVVSVPEHGEERIAIINAGSKILGLDRGGHGQEALKGFGRIVEHPNAVIVSLSEEVGKVDISNEPSIRLGEKVRVIPNHACVVANSTSWLVAVRGERVAGLIEVDMRNGLRLPRTVVETLSVLR
jgi:D-serine deaminase-like pyridoxal phosphate-dependent protein